MVVTSIKIVQQQQNHNNKPLPFTLFFAIPWVNSEDYIK